MTIWSGPHGPDYAPHPGQVMLLAELAPTTVVAPLHIPFDQPAGWSFLNPSVALDESVLIVTFRVSNFTIGDYGEYVIAGDGVTIRTANWLCALGDDLQVVAGTALPMHPDGPDRHPAAVDGCEDLRLFLRDGEWWASCAVWDRGPGTAQQALWDLGRNRLTVMHAPHDGPQKNWMPFHHSNLLHFLYRVEPCIVLAVPDQAVIAGWTTTGNTEWGLLRGGSQGVPVDDGFLFVVHEASLDPVRIYTHRIAHLTGPPWRIESVGPRWRFTPAPVEFCCGAARLGDDVVLSFGVNESMCATARLSYDQFVALATS